MTKYPLLDRVAETFPDSLMTRLENSKRAFIIGMGPSIRKLNLASLETDTIFGVNNTADTGLRHDILFVADDRRLTDTLQVDKVPIVAIDAVFDVNPSFFESRISFTDIEAVNYAQKIPDILRHDSLPRGLKKVFWTGSVVTDLVIPFAAEIGIPEVICVGLDGLDGSFPLTHAWGTDDLSLQLERDSRGSNPGALPASSLIAHLQEHTVHLARSRGTSVRNATPGGTTDSIPRAKAWDVEEGLWDSRSVPEEASGSYIAIGNAVFALHSHDPQTRTLELAHIETVEGVNVNRDLDGTRIVPEYGFVGPPTLALRIPNERRYLTTRYGYDRCVPREIDESFNTALSSYIPGDQISAKRRAHLIQSLADAELFRSTTGSSLRDEYVGATNGL